MLISKLMCLYVLICHPETDLNHVYLLFILLLANWLITPLLSIEPVINLFSLK